MLLILRTKPQLKYLRRRLVILLLLQRNLTQPVLLPQHPTRHIIAHVEGIRLQLIWVLIRAVLGTRGNDERDGFDFEPVRPDLETG